MIFQNSRGFWVLHDGATYQYFESEQEAKMAEMTNALAEQPAEYEIAATVIGDVLPHLRQALLALVELEMTWYANGIDVTIEKLAADENATLAGLPISAWMAWSAVFQSLNQWLNTPIDAIKTTPTRVLMRRYNK